jgi:hypothetical protein
MSMKASQTPVETRARSSKDRRAELRYKFSAAIEMVENGSDEKRTGRISDLSRHGCYVDMNPCYPLGTVAKIFILRDGQSFEGDARVVFSQDSKGMGILFTSIPPASVPILKAWVAISRETSWLAANRPKNQRTFLQMPVRVARLKGIAPAFQEDSKTVSVSTHGAMVLLEERVQKGQSLILSNVQSGSSVECIVAHIGEPEGRCLKVGMAFLLPNALFWPVTFPPEDWTPRHADAKQHGHRSGKN